MKKRLITTLTCLGLAIFTSVNAQIAPADALAVPQNKKSIKIGLLLDTSGSMDGLIEQAKSQLWKIVNKLSTATYQGQAPNVMISLYEYGNDGLSSRAGYIRQVTPLTSDLDKISQQLFALRTNGGSEFCGQVIQTAFKDLDWSASDSSLQVMFIAGNEPFNQGSVDYIKACTDVKNRNIFVNTIYCGDYQEGVRTFWKHGATLTEGSYYNINQNDQTVYYESPYDDQINQLNINLNNTYIYYGKKGAVSQQNQVAQDNNASKYGKVNSTRRARSKSSSLYSNSAWDLVDATDEKNFDVSKVDKNTLPKEYQGKSDAEIKKAIQEKKAQRERIKKEIQELGKKRDSFVAAEKAKASGRTQTLDDKMLLAIQKQGESRGFTFK